MAQNALEFAYKALIGAHSHEYPISVRDGNNLTILTQMITEHEIVSRDEAIPSENHRYLSEFGGTALHAREHPALNLRLIGEDIPDAVAQLTEMVHRQQRRP